MRNLEFNLFTILFFFMLFSGCDGLTTGAKDANIRDQETDLVNNMQTRKNATVRDPNLTDFRPADMFARTMEEQDKGVMAFAYIMSPMQGKFFFVCKAAAFPYPGGTQYTSPEVVKRLYQGGVTLPQADPNGLFTPATADATITPCWAQRDDINNPGNQYEAIYTEDKVNVFPGPLPRSLVINPDDPFVQ